MVVSVANPLVNGTIIHNNTYSITSTQVGPVAGVDDTTTVSSAPVLNISKADGPDPVNAGSNITYTISYSKTGNTNATDVSISDTIPAKTAFVSATGGGTLAAGVVTWNIGALAAGASTSVTLVVHVTSPLANGTVIHNSAYSIDSNETGATAGVDDTTTVNSSPTLNISKSDGPDPVIAGNNITYTISYSNTGNQNATGVVIADSIPVNTSFVSATGGGTLAAGGVSWNIGLGAPGSVTLLEGANSPLAHCNETPNTANYTLPPHNGPTASGDDATTAVTTPPPKITKTEARPAPVAGPDNISYTISYSNTGTAN